MQISRRQKQIAVALLALVLAAGVAFFVVRPSSPAGRFPPGFTDAEKREIYSVIRRDGFHRGLSALSHGQFSAAWRAIRETQRQSVYGVGNQGSGDVWLRVVIEDKSRPDGYDLIACYIMTKTNGQWKIGASDRGALIRMLQAQAITYESFRKQVRQEIEANAMKH